MNLACTVCYEILKSTDSIYAAPCGHQLHHHCWTGWLERMQNCPECRKPTLPHQLIKLFFNTGEGDDYCTLRNKYDSLRCELQCKISEVQTANALLEKQKGEIRDLKITREREWERFRNDIEELKTQERITQKRKHEEELSLKKKIKILQKQHEAIQIQYVNIQESKDTEEKNFMYQMKAVKVEHETIQKSKEKELEELRQNQKAHLQFLRQFSKRQNIFKRKLVEKLETLRRSEDDTDTPCEEDTNESSVVEGELTRIPYCA